MAARWGPGEEILTECNMDFFPMNTLDESEGLDSEGTLETLQSCLDPSILSIFEDTPTIEAKALDEESEATLLTALTEILDNVDDENLSPFDVLPDSDLLSGQKGREHSPLRRLLCLSRSPPGKDTRGITRSSSAGKSVPRIQAALLQRSDGEEEDDGSLTLSPERQPSSLENELLDWGGLTLPLPITLEQENENGVSVSLGDLVRHIHPYCMAICVEDGMGEQMLPEGGILLEVVDQGENGEPILAISDMDPPVSLPLQEHCSEDMKKVPDEVDEMNSGSSEHIVVDDEDAASEAPVKVAVPCSNAKDEMVIERPKEEIKEKTSAWRKKKKKCKEVCQAEPVERRVLRSSSVKKTGQESRKSQTIIKEKKKRKVPVVPDATYPTSSSLKNKKINSRQAQIQTEITTITPEMSVKEAASISSRQDTFLLNASPEVHEPGCPPTAAGSVQLKEMHQQLGPTPEKSEVLPEATSGVLPAAQAVSVASDSPRPAPSPVTIQATHPVCEAPPPEAPTVPEPKPKSLSLEEYRRLRQQKKAAPVEKQGNHSTKWPSLPELPKELPPIPCLPDPSPRDPRRTNPLSAKKEVEEVKPAWQPRGPCAPPTPEALLAPPAYMVASTTKVSTVTPKLQQPSVPQAVQTPTPSLPKNVSAPAPTSVKDLPAGDCTQRPVPHATESSGCLASSKQSSSALSVENSAVVQSLHSQPAELSTVCPKTTTEPVKTTTPNASAHIASSASPKATAIPEKVPELISPSSVNSTPSKLSTAGKQSCRSHPSDSTHHLKADPRMLGAKGMATTTSKCSTQELIEAFTNEIGIEAADLTSLLEQFEETQAKEEQCVPEVSGRAAAVGNSRAELDPEKTSVVRVRANDLSSTAALTPPATPPHQVWKPIAAVALLGKNRTTEASKSSPSKVIQIEAQPLPTIRSRNRPASAAATTADPDLACMDHDYCLPNKWLSTGEPGKRWNVKQQSSITIKPIQQPTAATTQSRPAASALSSSNAVDMKQEFTLTEPLDHRTEGSSILETPDASPARNETDAAVKETSPKRGHFGRSYCRRARMPSPRSSPNKMSRGRSRKREFHRSPSHTASSSELDSHSSSSRSRSHSPSKKRYRPRRSESSSSLSSRSSSRSSPSVSCSPPRRRRYSYSSSRSGSWSRSRSRSRSPHRQRQELWSRRRRFYSPSYRRGYGYNVQRSAERVKRRKEKAIEERRVVYVGRIHGSMTQKELKDRFSLFGEIEDCTLHFRDHGDNYGFVTYYDTKDAFTAIENGSKLRKPDELAFDLCFGGRRQFCQTSYSDLGRFARNTRNVFYLSHVVPSIQLEYL
ncbi:hypothetical protein LDENG_00195540 [Lucifuga dentata]|nr:hypothetical protein LDENG_00195540 [Lucifuga dentata]